MKTANYTKKFIILKTLYSNMKDLSPKGHGRLEARGQNLSINFSIQGAESTNYYDVLLIGDDKAHRLGSLYTEENRNGTVDFRLNKKDLEKLDFPLEKINGILIIRNSKILLGGYFGKDDGTINKYIGSMDYQLTKKSIEEVTMEEVPVVEPVDLEEVAEEASSEEVVAEVYPEEPVEDSILDMAEEVEELVEEITAEAYQLDLEKVFSDVENSYQKDYENYYMQNQPKESDYDLEYLINLLNYYPYIEPFKLHLAGYNWWRIDIVDLANEKNFLPYFDYIISRDYNQPLTSEFIGANQLIKKYSHYIFGLYENKEGLKYYIYGIAGLFTIDEYPQGGTTGFNTWYEGKENLGYWLLYLEPNTGRIIYPINPMIPTE